MIHRVAIFRVCLAKEPWALSGLGVGIRNMSILWKHAEVLNYSDVKETKSCKATGKLILDNFTSSHRLKISCSFVVYYLHNILRCFIPSWDCTNRTSKSRWWFFVSPSRTFVRHCQEEEHTSIQYAEAARTCPATYLSTNPIYCLGHPVEGGRRKGDRSL